jgi:hypothetical protein
MNPNLDFAQAIRAVNQGRGAGVLDGRVFIRSLQGMDFLAQTGVWDAKDQTAVRHWFEDYLHWLIHSRNAEDEKDSGNNHASWWTAQVAAVSGYVENKTEQQMALNYYREHIFPQTRRNGSTPREEARTRALSYSAFNLEAYSVICRMAQVRGTDLWNVRAKSGATIATVIDSLEPFFSDPKKWSKEQISDFPNDGLYFLAFAGMGLKNPAYLALYRKLERPESAWLSVVDLILGRWENAAHQTRH